MGGLVLRTCTRDRSAVLVLRIDFGYLYPGSKRVILHRSGPEPGGKKTTKTTEAIGTTSKRGRRRAVQYLLVFVGGVLVVDALVGDRGLVQMMKKRDEYRALEQTLTRARG